MGWICMNRSEADTSDFHIYYEKLQVVGVESGEVHIWIVLSNLGQHQTTKYENIMRWKYDALKF